jgi:hypothetical protein
MAKKWFSWTPKERGDDDEEERGTCDLGFEEDEWEEQGRGPPKLGFEDGGDEEAQKLGFEVEWGEEEIQN